MRNVFVIGPDKKVKLILVYPMTTGRNFDEVLRVIDSLQLTAKHKVSTPVNWSNGEDVVIAGSVSDDEAREIWPDGWESPSPTSGSCSSRPDPAPPGVATRSDSSRRRARLLREPRAACRWAPHSLEFVSARDSFRSASREAEGPAL